MNKSIHQIYFEPEQKSVLSQYTTPYYNEKLTPFFENDVIVDLYNKQVISNSDYFGILSWRIESKNHLSLTCLNNITEQFNMYGFHNILIRHHVLPMGSAYHQHFGYLFKLLLQNLGLDFDQLSHQVTMGLYQNAIIARKDIYLDYVENWLIPSMHFINNCENLQFQQLLRSDPMYSLYPTGRREKLLAHIGTPHYQYHTFILERLWSVYYYVNQSKISLALL